MDHCHGSGVLELSARRPVGRLLGEAADAHRGHLSAEFRKRVVETKAENWHRSRISRRHWVAKTPLGRTGQPSDTASVAFAVSPDAAWITGTTIDVAADWSSERALALQACSVGLAAFLG